MRIDANSWYYSPGHGQLCQVTEILVASRNPSELPKSEIRNGLTQDGKKILGDVDDDYRR